jgi:hypothetical protein
LNEEEARHEAAVAVKFRDLTGLQANGRKPLAFGTAIVHAYGKMAVTITMPIGLGAPLVESQFQLKLIFFVGQISEREVIEFFGSVVCVCVGHAVSNLH